MSKRVKQYLMLFAALGVVAIALGGGSGTFASFNAEIANNNNYFATGTLFLHGTKDGGTTCSSESAGDNMNITNIGGTCQALFQVSPISASGIEEARLTLKNAGTVDASDIQFSSPGCTSSNGSSVTAGTLSQDIHTTDTNLTLLHVSALSYGIPASTVITVDNGNGTDTFTTSAAAAAGATTIAVIPHTPNADFLASDPTNVTFVPSFGSGLLCAGLNYAIVETDSSFDNDNTNQALGCAYGFGTDGTTNGCTFGGTYTLNHLPSSMTPLTLSTSSPGNTGGELDANQSRYFVIRVTPVAAGLDNTYQNKKATFDLRWQIDQA